MKRAGKTHFCELGQKLKQTKLKTLTETCIKKLISLKKKPDLDAENLCNFAVLNKRSDRIVRLKIHRFGFSTQRDDQQLRKTAISP